MEETKTAPDRERTAAARAARRRAGEERWADRLRERGWQCISPYEQQSETEHARAS